MRRQTIQAFVRKCSLRIYNFFKDSYHEDKHKSDTSLS